MSQRLSFSLNLKTFAGAIGGLVLLSSASTFLLNSGKSQTPSFDIFSWIGKTIFSNLGTTGRSIQGFFGSVFSGFPFSTEHFSKITDFGKSIPEYWSSVTSFFKQGAQQIKPILEKIPEGFQAIYRFISENIGAFWGLIQSGWQELIPHFSKINKHLEEVKKWFTNGEFQKALKLYQKQFFDFFQDPKRKLIYFFSNFYRVTFKFFFPWSWAFLEEGIGSGKGFGKLWKYFQKQKSKFKEDLKEFFRFFHKYQVQLENMSHEDKKKIVKQLLEKPEEFFKAIKKLNELSQKHNLNSTDLNILNLIGKDENEVEKEIKKQVAKSAVKDVAKSFINSGEKIASGIENLISGSKETDKTISKSLTKIIEATTSAATDLVFDFFEGFFE